MQARIWSIKSRWVFQPKPEVVNCFDDAFSKDWTGKQTKYHSIKSASFKLPKN